MPTSGRQAFGSGAAPLMTTARTLCGTLAKENASSTVHKEATEPRKFSPRQWCFCAHSELALSTHKGGINEVDFGSGRRNRGSWLERQCAKFPGYGNQMLRMDSLSRANRKRQTRERRPVRRPLLFPVLANRYGAKGAATGAVNPDRVPEGSPGGNSVPSK
jgi:hypothetical protein